MFRINDMELFQIVDKATPKSLTTNDVISAIQEGLGREVSGKAVAGTKVGVLVGSRGIRNIQLIVKSVVQTLKEHGAEVVIIPAMGSHGGATAEGQSSLLSHYGINEAEIGAPVVSSMEVKKVDDINGHPVYVNAPVCDLDWIVPINRIKAHTDFHGPHESGLVKMLVIGLGKRAQAEAVHQHGIAGLRDLIPEVAKKVLKHVSLLGAVGIVENKWDETAIIEVLNGDNLFTREQELLKLSNQLLPKLPVKNLDVLVVEQMGKNISGVGIDPNITGRMRINGIPDEAGTASRLVVLDLTDHSEGNALGMGIADVITQRLYSKVNIEKTYINTITSGFLERCFIPVVAPQDIDAVRIAMQTCGRVVTEKTVRVAAIRNTLELSEVYVSEAVLPEISPEYEISSERYKMFAENGDFKLKFGI